MKTFVLFIAAFTLSFAAFTQTGPELVFTNSVLVSGTANKQGAVYRFPNVTPGVDATIKLKKFSRNDIVMSTIDNTAFGWNKAFQPEFGLPGLVQPNQHWYIDFEMTFYQAGTNNKQKMDTIDLTALDVDGDGNSISEYVTYDKPSSISYSVISMLTGTATGLPGMIMACTEDNISSTLVSCTNCGGDGMNSGDECGNCMGSGLLHDECDHAFQGGTGTNVAGPITNFLSIDTAATQVMATYQYIKKDNIKFRYGAKSASLASNGSGIRLNSTWFREFSLEPMSTLPVKLTSFSAMLNNSSKKVDLTWSTATEINASHFVIEKSTDRENFTDAATVFAFGNTTSQKSYAISDNISSNTAPVIYYRLRSVDLDGKTTVSEIRMIRIGKANETGLSVITYPNPVTDEVRITIPATWQNKKVTYEVFSASGQPVKMVNSNNSSQTETVNVKMLAPGFYMVRVTCEGQTAQQKIVKQ